jgi:tRNA(Ile)-lysidine synthase
MRRFCTAPPPAAATSSVFRRLRRRVRGEISRHKLLPPGSRVLVGVSGGQDSLALAEVLRSLQTSPLASPHWRHLALAHADHCWPGDAGCPRHVAAYALRANLPLHLADPGASHVAQSEAAARSWRYAALAEIARAHDYTHVAVGHTLSDLAETLFFNLTHGAGADGLSSLTWSRPLPVPASSYSEGAAGEGAQRPQLVRPLLSTARGETAAACAELELPVWHDVYNEDERYSRFRTRTHVLPYLRQHYNPRVEEALARTAHLLRDDAAALAAAARAAHAAAVSRVPGGEVRVERAALAAQPVAVQRRVMRMVLEEGGRCALRTPVFKQVDNLVALLTADEGAALPSLPRARAAAVEAGVIVLRDTPSADSVDGAASRRAGSHEGVGRAPMECRHRLLHRHELQVWMQSPVVETGTRVCEDHICVELRAQKQQQRARIVAEVVS